jgi:hypothetical protein
MKIAIVEVECHAEVLRSSILLFSKLPKYQLTIFTTPEIFTEAGFTLDSRQLNKVILKESTEKESTFIQRNINEINSNNYLLINSLQRKFNVYNRLNFTIPIALRVHNSNYYWSDSLDTKKYTLSNYKLLLKEIYKVEFLQRKQFLQKVNYFFFPSESVLNYTLQHYPHLQSKAYLLPLNFQNNIPKIPENNVKTIIIPGKVDRMRKDFDLLTAFIKMLNKKPLDFSIELVFLGITESTDANRFIDKLKQFTTTKVNIVHFTTIVPSEVYSNYLQNCTIVLCPIYTQTIFQLSKEIYGKTKVSGGINDAINFGKWCFVPKNYTVDSMLNKQVLTYDTEEDLYSKIIHTLTNAEEAPQQPKDSWYHTDYQCNLIQKIFK